MIGIAIATPIAVATAIWIVEYGRPSWLARAVESGIEIVAGTPDIVLAIFGLALFQQGIFSAASPSPPQGGAVFGRSFLTAGAMMSLIALPMVFGATREGLQSVPAPRARGVLRRWARRGSRRSAASCCRRSSRTSRPARRSAWAASPATPRSSSSCSARRCASIPRARSRALGLLRGTGGTLTSYVYNNSPAGEGNAPQKAYAAAFVLLLIVIGLNFAVDAIAKRGAQTGLESTRLGA